MSSDNAIEEASLLIGSAIREALITDGDTSEFTNPTDALVMVARAISHFTEAYEDRTKMLYEQGRAAAARLESDDE